jgi:methyl-accepting chemotaxis protein
MNQLNDLTSSQTTENSTTSNLPSVIAPDNTQLIDIVNSLIAGNYLIENNDTSPLGLALKALAERLTASSIQELDRVVLLSMCANETSMGSARLLYNLQRVSANSQAVASAAEELQASVQTIRTYSNEVNADNKNALNLVESVAAQLRQSVAAFLNITESVKTNSSAVTSLAGFASTVQGLSDEIKGIAFQTNILALNASVEAARAGDQGRGFAVIAQEMRTLANRSSDATQRISDLAKSFDSQMNRVASSLNETIAVVQTGQAAIAQVDENTQAMYQGLQRTVASIVQISESIDEQNTASTVVARNIARIASQTEHSVHSTDEIVDSIEQIQGYINEQINRLAELSLPNKIIKLAQSDHVIWKKRLVNMICGKQGLQEKELADHHSCRLGKWYDQVTDASLLQRPEFKQLLRPHQLVHHHGKLAVAAYNKGDIKAALLEIAEVETASVDVLNLLKSMEESK